MGPVDEGSVVQRFRGLGSPRGADADDSGECGGVGDAQGVVAGVPIDPEKRVARRGADAGCAMFVLGAGPDDAGELRVETAEFGGFWQEATGTCRPLPGSLESVLQDQRSVNEQFRD